MIPTLGAMLTLTMPQIYAFEATPSKAKRIEQELKDAGHWHKVVLFSAAASNVSGTAKLFTPDGAKVSWDPHAARGSAWKESVGDSTCV